MTVRFEAMFQTKITPNQILFFFCRIISKDGRLKVIQTWSTSYCNFRLLTKFKSNFNKQVLSLQPIQKYQILSKLYKRKIQCSNRSPLKIILR